MNKWNWKGAKWWKFDFHTHTPISDDYGKNSRTQSELKARTAREWLMDYMTAGIDCVAITDHNSGAWVDTLKIELKAMQNEQPDGYRPLHLFPGVELSVHGSVHILAILGQEKTTGDIDSLLGAVGFRGVKGKTDAVTEKSLPEVAEIITQMGGIVIPAHVDDINGVFQEVHGETLRQTLDSKNIFTMEVIDNTAAKPEAYLAAKLNWTEVIGSDAHHPTGEQGQNFPGSRFTWVKMGIPNVDGLRLALLDGDLSICRSDTTKSDPNSHADLVIESVEVDKAKHMGRPTTFKVDFNPWMNAIIGGRGSGKSTLLEFIRIAMRRDKELPDELESDFKKYSEVYISRNDSGLLTPEASIKIIYRKNNVRYGVQWSQDGLKEPIKEQQPDGRWIKSEGDIPQRFPIRMYSQKQIFQLAKDPLALMRIINDAPEVGYWEWCRSVEAEEGKYLALRTKAREIAAGLSDEPRLKGELEDITRKLALFEKSDHAEIYKEVQLRKRQASILDTWETSISQVGSFLRQVADEIEPEEVDTSVFDVSKPENFTILEQVCLLSAKMNAVVSSTKKMGDEADKIAEEWKKIKQESQWNKAVNTATAAFNDLQKRMVSEGIIDTSTYGQLVQRKQLIERQLREFAGRRSQIALINEQADTSLVRLKELRQRITQMRKRFLTQVLANNQLVRINVVPYGAVENIEEQFRVLIQRTGSGFEKDIGQPEQGGLLGVLCDGEPNPTDFESRIDLLKKQVRDIAENPNKAAVADRRFAMHLAKLLPEALDRLDMWFPDDSLAVEYCNPATRDDFRPIHEGSPGQKTAALLAFLLTYGQEPLILDQPEDDLDNHLIYDLIVGQLREIKQKRQVIVVTHNANIVVNGDAELVFALTARGGQTHQDVADCLQEKEVRQQICLIMEGGKEAFEKRYRRIALEVQHV